MRIVIQKHTDGFVAYPLGVKGVVVGEGDTYEEALADARSAVKFHAETFGLGTANLAPSGNREGTFRRRVKRRR